jgi:inosine-uridine nucleoside N-ribohydrolase
MGGALNYRDPSRAEHNFRLDPAAARAMLATLPRLRLVTSDVTFTAEIEVNAASPIYRALAGPHAPAWAELLRLHLDRWFARFHPGSRQHDALTLSAAMQLPFVSFDLMPVVLADDARMSSGPGGSSHFVSTKARYGAFNDWLARGLGVANSADVPS